MSELANKALKFIPGVGPVRATVLEKELQVHHAEQMLFVFPYKYVDRTRFYRISELTADLTYVQLRGKIMSFEVVGSARSKRLTARFTDGSDVLELVWFRGLKYIQDRIKTGVEYIVFGRISVFNHQLSLPHPDLETPAQYASIGNAGLQPFYNTTEKMKSHHLNSKAIHGIQVHLIKSMTQPFPETLPIDLLRKFRLMPLHDALVQMHMPTHPDLLKQARYRLAFEELFFLQLNILRYKSARSLNYKGFPFEQVGALFHSFFAHYLPYVLTEAQKRVIREIRADLGRPIQMNRLLQGDVGSGKTLVALMSMLLAVDNGFQAAMMAPTEILAHQHLETLQTFLQDMPIRVALLTGSTKAKERKQLHADLLSGELNLLVGTHALIEDTVQFANLGLVVIDEQHRFGVEQRSRMWLKNDRPPHVLVMTATPIPRTLAMTVYGDLDVSVIDELPPGRKPIQTMHQYDNRRTNLYAFIREQLAQGRQIYVVYPLIQESEKSDYKNLEEGIKHIQEVFPSVPVGMVHGKMKPADKDAAMLAFANGETRILVATTVIEVGVNVPNASVMLIESAERFGLSQLHQLRGRVGRGGDQSYCVLLTSHKLSEESRKRIEIMCSTNDGFEIAEADMKMRGPGDLEGTQQSGIPFDLKVAHLSRDGQLLEYVRNVAKGILEEDPTLEKERNALLKIELKKRFSTDVNWSVIS
ncbi:MAG: ATP-dependent DNA helicase RecG [Bacteroidales bacterium]|nr:ATP-dependent DNA helicase RecG [Bacteroidales bacterium]